MDFETTANAGELCFGGLPLRHSILIEGARWFRRLFGQT
jgi:hypothetical protein